MLLWLLPVALAALECLFLRTCLVWEFGSESRAPRAVLAMLMLLSIVPVFGGVVVLSTITVMVMMISIGDLEVSSNRFTRYWFGVD